MTESGYYLLLMNLSTVMMLTLLHNVHLATTFGRFDIVVGCDDDKRGSSVVEGGPYIDNDNNKRLACDHTCSEIRRCSLELWFSFSTAMIKSIIMMKIRRKIRRIFIMVLPVPR